MRSALICVLVAFTVHKERGLAADEEFRPTPIPLTEWNIGDGQGGAGTLQETLATEAPPAVAALPAHYWEDALRHSVYLTLVRDKIDQLIAKTSIVSSDSKPEHQNAKEVDDRDLWDKIKSAPFDRLKAEEPSNLGDIAVVAKGRLLEESGGFRFTEDELTKEKCKEEKCMESVKAFWSVKRVRQRDAETMPGKHHYELTFSVSSQTPKKHSRPFENPVRTFTVREGTPVEKPQYRQQYGPPTPPPRPQRAIWFHKNIAPAPHPVQEHGLDRLFSSWFGTDEESRETPVKRFRYSHHNYPQRSKVGYVGLQSEQHNQKQLVPYSYKPHSYKGARPLGPPPVQHTQYNYNMDYDGIRQQNHYTPAPTEYKHGSSNAVKTTRPAVLPTPPSEFAVTNITMKKANISSTAETTTRESDIITAFTTYSKPKPTKINYFPDHVRPPIFNAPPGVFVTMEKKPFKPMPPLKFIHGSKPLKIKPIDFRPSPQVLDVQFSDPDPLSDAFRPITMSYAGSNTTETSELADSDKVNHFRKTKPPKKHDKVKSQRTTTNAPEIITAYDDGLDGMHWANILGAFTKATSMDYSKSNATETTSSVPFTSVATHVTEKSTSTTTETEPSSTTVRTTNKPRRTRPPPKFTKPVKSKKHKRVTTTTTTTTSTESSPFIRTISDLSPQASSSATRNGAQFETGSNARTENVTVSTTPMTANNTNYTSTTFTTESSVSPTTKRSSTTTQQTTTRQKLLTTTKAPNSTNETVSLSSTFPPRSKNRFRQSTLMIKGTSVKHDKWNTPFFANKTTTERSKLVQPLNTKVPFRRKGSNFQGYVSSTAKTIDEENVKNHADDFRNGNINVISISSTTEITTHALATSASSSSHVSQKDTNESENDAFEDIEEDQENENDEDETQDHGEYIFTTTSMDAPKDVEESETTNEVESEGTTTEETVVDVAPALNYARKNKTKCKNKKQNSTANYETLKSNGDTVKEIPKSIEDEVSVKPISTTEKMSTSDFFDEIFGFTMDQNETGAKNTDSKYVDNDDDLEEFLQSINKKSSSNDTNDDEYTEDEREDSSPFNNDEENRFPRHADKSYDEYQDQPLSFLELMAME